VTIQSPTNPNLNEENPSSGFEWPTSLAPGDYLLSAYPASYPNLDPVKDFPFTVKEAKMNVGVPLQFARVYFPSDAGEVSVAGSTWTQTGPPLIWKPGPVTLTFRKDGFLLTNVTVTLVPGQRLDIPVPPPPYGTVTMTGDPPEGATAVDSSGNTLLLPAQTNLPPGSYQWRGQYAGLEDVPKSFTVRPGETASVKFNFNYGILDLSVEPPEAAVTQEDGRVLKPPPPYHLLLKPGQARSYSIESAGRVGTNFTVALNAGQALRRSIVLAAQMFLAHLATDPPGGEVKENDRILETDIKLAGGNHQFTATYPGLEPVSTNITVNGGGPLVLRFHYGTLAFDSSPPGASVFRGDQLLGLTPTNVFLPPAPESSFTLIFESQTNVKTASVSFGLTNSVFAQFTNTGVKIIKLDDANELRLKKFAGYWVGQYDVTQGQYQAVMGSNPSHFNKDLLKTDWNPLLPVESVNLDDALGFCKALTQKENKWLLDNTLAGYTFGLPSKEEWNAFQGGDGTNPKLVFFNQGENGRTQPVGRQGANTNGIYDVCGDVSQWLADGWVAGPSFKSRIVKSMDGTKPGNNARDPTVGFRVVLKPPLGSQ
jgi:hypothetical protein